MPDNEIAGVFLSWPAPNLAKSIVLCSGGRDPFGTSYAFHRAVGNRSLKAHKQMLRSGPSELALEPQSATTPKVERAANG